MAVVVWVFITFFRRICVIITEIIRGFIIIYGKATTIISRDTLYIIWFNSVCYSNLICNKGAIYRIKDTIKNVIVTIPSLISKILPYINSPYCCHIPIWQWCKINLCWLLNLIIRVKNTWPIRERGNWTTRWVSRVNRNGNVWSISPHKIRIHNRMAVVVWVFITFFRRICVIITEIIRGFIIIYGKATTIISRDTLYIIWFNSVCYSNLICNKGAIYRIKDTIKNIIVTINRRCTTPSSISKIFPYINSPYCCHITIWQWCKVNLCWWI